MTIARKFLCASVFTVIIQPTRASCASPGCCCRVNNLLFHSRPSPPLSSLGVILAGRGDRKTASQHLPSCVTGRQYAGTGAGALQGVGWRGKDTCSSLQLTPCSSLFILYNVIKVAIECHLCFAGGLGIKRGNTDKDRGSNTAAKKRRATTDC